MKYVFYVLKHCTQQIFGDKIKKINCKISNLAKFWRVLVTFFDAWRENNKNNSIGN